MSRKPNLDNESNQIGEVLGSFPPINNDREIDLSHINYRHLFQEEDFNHALFHQEHYHHQSQAVKQNQELLDQFKKFQGDFNQALFLQEQYQSQAEKQKQELLHQFKKFQDDFNHALFHQEQYQSLLEKQKQELEELRKFQYQSQEEKRKQELLNQLRMFQSERFKFILKEQSKTLAQKDQEIAQLLCKKIEHDDRLNKLEIENQTLKAHVCNRSDENTVVVEDEASSCVGVSPPERKCSNCGSIGETIVLILPCRHLSCCPECEACVIACPICRCLKKKSIVARLT